MASLKSPLVNKRLSYLILIVYFNTPLYVGFVPETRVRISYARFSYLQAKRGCYFLFFHSCRGSFKALTHTMLNDASYLTTGGPEISTLFPRLWGAFKSGLRDMVSAELPHPPAPSPA